MKRLLLLGGGHAHLQVLTALATHPLAGWEVHLVTPNRRLIYSGMLPGWVAGHYQIDACSIPLDRLAANAGVSFHETSGLGLDLARSELHRADGRRLGFDALSIDTGPLPDLQGLAIDSEQALPVRPLERFVAAWPALAERIQAQAQAHRFKLIILGAGAAGVELAFAIQHRAACAGWRHLDIGLIGAEPWPLGGAPEAARRRIARLLEQRGIRWIGARQANRVESQAVHFEQGEPQPCDACLVCTGAAAPAWPAAAGLATDARGFIRVERSLQSRSHPHIFAAGDVAAHADPQPKSGVYAVRAGPVLADNLRAHCEGRPLRAWTPPARALALISTGDLHAVAIWGRWSWQGHWVWRWKDQIDRRFVQRFQAPAASAMPARARDRSSD